MPGLRSIIRLTLGLAAAGLLASPAAGVAHSSADPRTAADREAQRFLRDVGPASSIAVLPSGPCMALDRRSAVCPIAMLIRVEVDSDRSAEPWRCDAYVMVVRRHGRTSTRRSSADCHP